MSRSMVARCLAFLLAVFLAAPTLLAQVPKVKEKLPDGVMMRLGGGGLRGQHAAMSPDGKLIATSATDGPGKFKFCLVNASDGELIYSMESKDFEHMYGCVFSHDSKLLAGNEVKDGVIQGTCLWDVAAQIKRGAQVNARSAFGDTPLHIAAAHGDKGVAEALIAAGAEVNAQNEEQRTPLAVALQKGQTEIAALLRKHGGKE